MVREDHLTLLYVFTGFLFALLFWLLKHEAAATSTGWGVAIDLEGLKSFVSTGRYDVREREAWDSPTARATLTGAPPYKKREREKKPRGGRASRTFEARVFDATRPRASSRRRRGGRRSSCDAGAAARLSSF